jgi:hypothetical protein
MNPDETVVEQTQDISLLDVVFIGTSIVTICTTAVVAFRGVKKYKEHKARKAAQVDETKTESKVTNLPPQK